MKLNEGDKNKLKRLNVMSTSIFSCEILEIEDGVINFKLLDKAINCIMKMEYI